jgi:alkylhydroperoxidase family enzyme
MICVSAIEYPHRSGRDAFTTSRERACQVCFAVDTASKRETRELAQKIAKVTKEK